MIHMIAEEDLDPGALALCALFAEEGHKAYLVGGCLRDMLLGRPPSDWDLCTSAHPEETMALCARHRLHVRPTGIKHGTVRVRRKRSVYEVTTLRRDGDYSDGRRPDSVFFTGDVDEDLSRRDFTINAMAYMPGTGLIDPLGGTADCRDGVIRAVGDPIRRFDEDALRMLRAARFAAVLGFAVEADTLAAMHSQCAGIDRVASERIAEELRKLICAPHPEALLLLYETGLLERVLPELHALWSTLPGEADAGLAALRRAPGGEEGFPVRLAILLRHIGDESGESRLMRASGLPHGRAYARASAKATLALLKRLRYPRRYRETAATLVYRHAVVPQAQRAWVMNRLRDYGAAGMAAYLSLHRALLEDGAREHAALDTIEAILRKIEEKKEPYAIDQLAINGDDLAELGFYKEGIGKMLRRCCDRVIRHPEQNRRDLLIAYALSVKESRAARWRAP